MQNIIFKTIATLRTKYYFHFANRPALDQKNNLALPDIAITWTWVVPA